MTTVVLRGQHPGDVLDHAIDCADWLATGDALSTVAVAADAGITVGSSPAPAISGTSVVFWLSGGTTGTTYNVQVTITTTGGRTKVIDCTIEIEDPTP